MKVLVVGNGAREHAVAWKLRIQNLNLELLTAPGNAGTATIGENIPIASTDVKRLLNVARERKIDFTIVGPEQPLVDGIVDRFREAGMLIFGPTQAAAQIESSKIFAKKLIEGVGIPTAHRYATFASPTGQNLPARHRAHSLIHIVRLFLP